MPKDQQRHHAGHDIDISYEPWNRLYDQIADATERLWVLQTWLPVLHGNLHFWEAAMRAGASVRVLLLDQGLVGHRLRFRNRDASFLPQNVVELAQLATQYPGQLEGRFYSNLPLGPIYVIDDLVHWGLYFAHRDSMEGPRFTAPAGSLIGKNIIESYQRTWENSPWFSGEFQLPTADRIPSKAQSLEASAMRARADLVGKMHLATSVRHLERHHGAAFFVRHGETDMGVAGLVTGDLNVGINSNGVRAARMLGQQLGAISAEHPWDQIWASPLRRTTETLQHMLGGLDGVSQRSELGERLMGKAVGDFKENHPRIVPGEFTSRDLSSGDNTFASESYAHVFTRLAPLLAEIHERVENGERLLICTHEGPIRMLRWAFDSDLGITDALAMEIPYAEPFVLVSDPKLKSHVGPRAILRVDIVNSTGIAETSGPSWAAKQIAFRQEAASTIERHGGSVFGEPGDEVLASFEDPQAAMECGLEVLERVKIDLNGKDLTFRAGIDQGVVTVHSMNVEGLAVNRASRIVEFAKPGHMAVSESIYWTLRDSGRYSFEEPQVIELKGLREPATIYLAKRR